jgi:hypothetical protein
MENFSKFQKAITEIQAKSIVAQKPPTRRTFNKNEIKKTCNKHKAIIKEKNIKM